MALLVAVHLAAIPGVGAGAPEPPLDPTQAPGLPENQTVPSSQDANTAVADAWEALPWEEALPGQEAPEAPQVPEPPTLPEAPEGPGTPDVPDAAQQMAQAMLLLHAVADPILGMLPEDPVKFVEDTIIKPAQDIPNQVTPLVMPAEEEAPSDGRPAGEATAVLSGQLTPETIVLMGATAAAATAVVLWLVGSSGSVSAGASSASGLSKDLRRLLPFASPLFTRFEKDTVLGHPKREALYALIIQDPGVSLQALCEATGLSRTAVTHHLRLMELQHIVVSKRVGRSRHYYENGGRFGREQKEAYAVLQNNRSRQVAEYVKANPGTIQKQLCDGLGIQASIAHWHVRRLREAGLVEEVREGRTVRYLPGAALSQLVAPPLPPPPAARPPASPAPSPGVIAPPPLPAAAAAGPAPSPMPMAMNAAGL